MSSIFDQYEATISKERLSQRSSRSSSSAGAPHDIVASGYISATIEDETPIFSKSKVLNIFCFIL